ncbi:MAG: DNA-binding response regulator [Geobacteraceae bacterium GWC2_58_44]|nr:MAG: DNA-binding response regulator [Geobacteraceae bacterium GWC2_58_44]HBG06085.1 DNA-binding response regulator [Geobacter sp.]
MSIRILLADDHTMFREGLRALLDREQDMTVVAEAEDGKTAVERTLEVMPDVVLLDISMPVLNGIEAARMIHDRAEKVGIIILTMHTDKQYLIEALKLGVRSFILKDWASEELVTAVRCVYNATSYLSPRLSDVIISGFTARDDEFQNALTPREEQAFRLLANGKNCKEIAFELQISSKTVETYRLKVMKKLNVTNMAQLVKHAVQVGIVQRD